MIRRVRWYRLESNPTISPRQIGDMMNKFRYTNKSGAGFRLDTVHNDRVDGKFIERVETTEHVEDPFGKLVESNRVMFRSVGFRIRTKSPELEIINPSRATHQFVAKLAEMFRYSVIIEPMRVDLKTVLGCFERHVGSIKVLSMEATHVSLSNAIEGRIAVQGTEDVRDALNGFVGVRSYKVDRMSISWAGPGSVVSCDLTRFGAKFEETNELAVYPVLRKVMATYTGGSAD